MEEVKHYFGECATKSVDDTPSPRQYQSQIWTKFLLSFDQG